MSDNKLSINVDGIIAIVAALPTFIELLNRVALVIEKSNLAGFMSDMEASVDLLENAKSTQDKLNAVTALVSNINKLR